MAGPLTGIRVLDLSRILAGPWASQLLADLGADVIKVERPGSGDDTRHWGPPFLKDKDGTDTPEAAYFLATNRGKRSVCIDLSKAEGQRLVRDLAERSDVVLENFKVGTLRRYRLSWEDLEAVNPRLIYCSISAFGQSGPSKDEPGYDAMIQATGGLMSITGVPDGEPGEGPVKVGVAIADIMAGMYAVAGILAALVHRRESGEGQHIDLSLLDTQVAMLANQNMNYLIGGQIPRRRGTAHPNIVPYQAFATRDGHLILAVGNDAQFATLVDAIDRPGLASDPRFITNAARVQNRDALIPILGEVLRERTTAEWIDLIKPLDIPCGPINDIAQVFDEPQIRHRAMQIDIDHPELGAIPGVRSPLMLSATPLDYALPPPMLGEHTEQVLREELGLNDADIQRLKQQEII